MQRPRAWAFFTSSRTRSSCQHLLRDSYWPFHHGALPTKLLCFSSGASSRTAMAAMDVVARSGRPVVIAGTVQHQAYFDVRLRTAHKPTCSSGGPTLPSVSGRQLLGPAFRPPRHQLGPALGRPAHVKAGHRLILRRLSVATSLALMDCASKVPPPTGEMLCLFLANDGPGMRQPG